MKRWKEIIPEGKEGLIGSLLSDREKTILQQLHDGKTIEEVASVTPSRKKGGVLKPNSVYQLIGNLLRKTLTRSRDNLIALLVEEGSLRGEATKTAFDQQARSLISDVVDTTRGDKFIIKGVAGDIEITERQLEIVRLRRSGLSFKEIGSLLGISERTAEAHLYNVTQNNAKALGLEPGIRYGKKDTFFTVLVSRLNAAGLLAPENEEKIFDQMSLVDPHFTARKKKRKKK